MCIPARAISTNPHARSTDCASSLADLSAVPGLSLESAELPGAGMGDV